VVCHVARTDFGGGECWDCVADDLARAIPIGAEITVFGACLVGMLSVGYQLLMSCIKKWFDCGSISVNFMPTPNCHENLSHPTRCCFSHAHERALRDCFWKSRAEWKW
jgi:hypothetical protein